MSNNKYNNNLNMQFKFRHIFEPIWRDLFCLDDKLRVINTHWLVFI